MEGQTTQSPISKSPISTRINYVFRHHRLSRLRLSHVLPRLVSRADSARPARQDQPELSRRIHAQGARRRGGQHRLHHEAARRRPRCLCHRGPGLRRLPPLDGRSRPAHRPHRGDCGRVHGLILCGQRPGAEPDRHLLHRRHGPCPQLQPGAARAGRRAGRAHQPQRPGRDAALRPGVPAVGHPVRLRPQPADRPPERR